MFEQCTTESATHRVGGNPKMIEMEAVLFIGENIEADGICSFSGAKTQIGCDERWSDRQNILPLLDPGFRVTPMPLGSVSNLSQCSCFFWFGTHNLHSETVLVYRRNRTNWRFKFGRFDIGTVKSRRRDN